MPASEVQQSAYLWLANYVNTYGDHIPNSPDDINLHLLRRKDVYDEYCSQKTTVDEDIVTYERFMALWRVLLPKAKSRPWCNVTGKCDTCFEINDRRRKAVSAVVLNKLQEAHCVHRGGLFMLERME